MKEHPEGGLLIAYTGPGKGKTTAALGLVARAMGWGHQPAVVQFIKGKWQTGERRYFEKLAADGHLVFDVRGRGFTWESDDLSRDRQAAQQAWETARGLIVSEKHQVVVLDELTYVINYGFVNLTDVMAVLADRPPHVTVVITGRNCPEEIIEAADLVTEMKDQRHPYHKGYRAIKGVDY